MSGILKGLLKILAVIVAIAIILVAVVFGLRFYNSNKYSNDAKSGENSEFTNPSDLSSYDLNIEGVKVDHIKGNYMNGFHLKPNNLTHKGVIITFGGSEGSPNYSIAKILADNGFEVLSLFFFGADNQQKELVEVPLDFFDEVLSYVKENTEDSSVITLYGASKGAELALNLASRYSEINNVVLIAPSEYSYIGLSYSSNEPKSSWTWNGDEVDYISLINADSLDSLTMTKDMITMSPVSYRPVYESAVENAPNKEGARIKVEDTKANILLVAGTDDLMWQSDTAAENIYNKRPENTEKLIYDGAGHVFFADRYTNTGFMVLAFGGDLETNTKAGLDSGPKILEKLIEWHK